MANFNFKTRRGNSVPMTVVVTVDGSPYDLTDHEIFFTAKEDPSQSDDDAIIKRSTAVGDGITITNAAGGQAKIMLTPTNTDAVPIDVALYCDVQIKTPSGEIYTVANGKITFLQDITRRTS